jgi:hypothetical protein
MITIDGTIVFVVESVDVVALADADVEELLEFNVVDVVLDVVDPPETTLSVVVVGVDCVDDVGGVDKDFVELPDAVVVVAAFVVVSDLVVVVFAVAGVSLDGVVSIGTVTNASQYTVILTHYIARISTQGKRAKSNHTQTFA